jgi:hypothetical protein
MDSNYTKIFKQWDWIVQFFLTFLCEEILLKTLIARKTLN